MSNNTTKPPVNEGAKEQAIKYMNSVFVKAEYLSDNDYRDALISAFIAGQQSTPPPTKCDTHELEKIFHDSVEYLVCKNCSFAKEITPPPTKAEGSETYEEWQVKYERFGLADTGDYCFQESITNGVISLTNYKEEHMSITQEVADKLNKYPDMVKALRYAWISLDDGTSSHEECRKMITNLIGEVKIGM